MYGKIWTRGFLSLPFALCALLVWGKIMFDARAKGRVILRVIQLYTSCLALCELADY